MVGHSWRTFYQWYCRRSRHKWSCKCRLFTWQRVRPLVRRLADTQAQPAISDSLPSLVLLVTRCLTTFCCFSCSGGPGRPGTPGLPGQPGAKGRDIYAVLEQATDEQHVHVKLANQVGDYALPLLLRSDGGCGSSGGNGGVGGTVLSGLVPVRLFCYL